MISIPPVPQAHVSGQGILGWLVARASEAHQTLLLRTGCSQLARSYLGQDTTPPSESPLCSLQMAPMAGPVVWLFAKNPPRLSHRSILALVQVLQELQGPPPCPPGPSDLFFMRQKQLALSN